MLTASRAFHHSISSRLPISRFNRDPDFVGADCAFPTSVGQLFNLVRVCGEGVVDGWAIKPVGREHTGDLVSARRRPVAECPRYINRRTVGVPRRECHPALNKILGKIVPRSPSAIRHRSAARAGEIPPRGIAYAEFPSARLTVVSSNPKVSANEYGLAAFVFEHCLNLNGSVRGE